MHSPAATYPASDILVDGLTSQTSEVSPSSDHMDHDMIQLDNQIVSDETGKGDPDDGNCVSSSPDSTTVRH
ncbi:hypothetical protein PGTUg99_025590 [Puccinia graminis f. sp. tritici]|uniref:Uncharacterized protein n=1 Tax=Puccinia graminis f. sp. tritici TaxID=56615 RepID=A0A5B0N059_PUCGR|nr:hypothetical protein PGTUg99_025590 [Puccinia graminis f. sp. tritici]